MKHIVQDETMVCVWNFFVAGIRSNKFVKIMYMPKASLASSAKPSERKKTTVNTTGASM